MIKMIKQAVIFFALFLALQATMTSQVHGYEFRVGGPKVYWSVPNPNHTEIYNVWASHNRFQIGDTLRFKYVRDSVLEVSEEDYKKCNSSDPKMFSNTGDTLVKLDRRGSFFFISGVSGHCLRGQRIIIKVKSPSSSSSSPPSSSSDGYKSSLGVVVSAFVLSFFASVFV